MSTAKNSILKKIRMALAQPTPLPFPESEGNDSVFQPQQQDLVVEFAEQFTQLLGKFVFCLDEKEFIENFQKLYFQQQWSKIYCMEENIKRLVPPNILSDDIINCDASLTTCEALVARTGTMVLSATQQGRLPSVYAPVHVCLAYTSQLVYDIKDALNVIKDKYKQSLPSLITFATGPSRTADIEKTLVVGVHGPKEVYCFIIDDQQ
ncbi:MAG: LutC/YkgG family protein [Candidatus Dadabacteria bacterium]